MMDKLFGIEPEPQKLFFLLVGVIVAGLAYVVAMRLRLEAELRRGRSPNQVRGQAAALAMGAGVLLPTFMGAWGLGWPLLLILLGLIAMGWARPAIVAWLLLLVIAVIVVGKSLFHAHAS